LGVDRRSLGERALRGDGGEGVEDAIMFRDPRQRRAHDRGRAGAAVANGGGNLARMRPGGVHRGRPQAEEVGAGSASSGSGKSANRAASASVTSRLVLTALFQAGSSLRSSACAAASTKLSRGSRPHRLPFTCLPLARTVFAAAARDGLNFPLRND